MLFCDILGENVSCSMTHYPTVGVNIFHQRSK